MSTLNAIQGHSADASASRSSASRSAAPEEAASASESPALGDLSIAIPALGVTATFSPASMKLLADLPGSVAGALQDGGAALGAVAGQAAHALGGVVGDLGGSVAHGAEALADGLGAAGSKVADIAETVLGYGVAAALVGGAVLDELV
ncbi:MAG: hypothetical protein ABW005_12960 [Burkholderiaceae bacterium]